MNMKWRFVPKRPIEMQVASLLKKFEAIDAENKLLGQELDVVKEAHKKEVKEMKSTYEGEINQLKRELNEIKAEDDGACYKLREHQEVMKFEVEENSKVLKGLEEKCNALQNNKAPLSLPPYYFSVLNTDRYLERNLDFVSTPFYSHPGGYKMDVSVQSNAECAGSIYLDLYVSILCGEFDNQLK